MRPVVRRRERPVPSRGRRTEPSAHGRQPQGKKKGRNVRHAAELRAAPYVVRAGGGPPLTGSSQPKQPPAPR